MNIRLASPKDLTELNTLFCAYLDFYKKTYEPQITASFLRERMIHSESRIFVAEINGKLVGFTQLYPSFSSLSQKKSWILNDLFVDSNFRKIGVAKKLIEMAVKFSKTTGSIGLSLQTAKDNHSAQKLYESLNWKKDETYLTYYFSHE